MLSTFLGYQLYGNNLTQSLARTAAEPAVSQAEAYYNANIGKVKTVSDLVGNYRLLSYAAQAFGLQDMTYAKALLTKVLTSNLSDPTSVANKLNDSRYTAFAQAFNFKPDGTLSTTAQLQTSAQQSSTETLFQANTTLSTSAAAAATTAYAAAIKSITSVAQLERSPAALGYVLVAYGIDPSSAASTFEPTLESDLATPSSYIDQQADSGFQALSKAFDVDASGNAETLVEAQTDTNIAATTAAYANAAGSTSADQTAAATETSYYLSKISSITNASQLTGDSRLLAYVIKAYGLPSNATATTVQNALTSDTSTGTSFANTSPYKAYATLAKAFDFTTSGAAGTVTQFQSGTQQQSTVALYAARQSADTPAADAATAYYNANIGKITSVGGLEADSKLMSYVLTAYGLGSDTSDATLSSVMENTGNIATTSSAATLLNLKLAFNVDGSGNAINPLTAQSPANVSATTNAYMLNAGTGAAAVAAAKTATTAYKTAIAKVTSVGALLADPKLGAYIESAYNIPTATSLGTLQKVLTSDVTNSKSVANTMGSNFNQLAAAFDFTPNGLIGAEQQGAQSKAQLNSVNNAYVEQQMESEASAQNPGIGLALYLGTNASKIIDAYSILADKKLTSIFQTLLGLPATTSNADIDAQAKTISSQFDLSDLKNPKKVQALVERFSILYDLNPPTSTAPLTTASLFSGSTSTLDVTSLFSSSSS